MRTKRRAALALATAAAVGAGLIAFTGSASALSFCTPAAPNPTAGNRSCVNGAITPNTGLGFDDQEREPVHAHFHQVPASRQRGSGRVREDGVGAVRQPTAGSPRGRSRSHDRAAQREEHFPGVEHVRAAPALPITPTCRRRQGSADGHQPRRRRTSTAACWCSRPDGGWQPVGHPLHADNPDSQRDGQLQQPGGQHRRQLDRHPAGDGADGGRARLRQEARHRGDRRAAAPLGRFLRDRSSVGTTSKRSAPVRRSTSGPYFRTAAPVRRRTRRTSRSRAASAIESLGSSHRAEK